MTEQTTTHSIPLADLTLEQLVQLSQGLGRDIEKLREQRAYLKEKIADRLARGERTSVERSADGADAQAPGAFIEVGTGA